MNRFDQKTVIVTGAGSGIGRACVERLLDEGAEILAVDLNAAALAALQAEHGDQPKLAIHECNVADEAAVEAMVADCLSQFSKIDCLVNMAGILKFSNFHEMDFADWKQIIDVNVHGSFLVCKAVLPSLMASKGNIINAASTAALQGVPWGAAYGASKGAVLAMTRSIAVEYAKRGVRANCICPGEVRTAMADNVQFPEDADFSLLNRILSLTGAKGPEVVASVVAMLGSDDGIHITGESIRIDGGTLA